MVIVKKTTEIAEFFQWVIHGYTRKTTFQTALLLFWKSLLLRVTFFAFIQITAVCPSDEQITFYFQFLPAIVSPRKEFARFLAVTAGGKGRDCVTVGVVTPTMRCARIFHGRSLLHCGVLRPDYRQVHMNGTWWNILRARCCCCLCLQTVTWLVGNGAGDKVPLTDTVYARKNNNETGGRARTFFLLLWGHHSNNNDRTGELF